MIIIRYCCTSSRLPRPFSDPPAPFWCMFPWLGDWSLIFTKYMNRSENVLHLGLLATRELQRTRECLNNFLLLVYLRKLEHFQSDFRYLIYLLHFVMLVCLLFRNSTMMPFTLYFVDLIPAEVFVVIFFDYFIFFKSTNLKIFQERQRSRRRRL